MNPPIVMVAFGTRGPANATYEYLDRQVHRAFPRYEIHWAYSSRMVRHLAARKEASAGMPGPDEVLAALVAAGHRWAVLQSIHLLCGHEFHRLLGWAAGAPLRTAVGLPLLTDPEDFDHITGMLAKIAAEAHPAATVFVGHGTDHPTWMAYWVLQSLLRDQGADRAFVGLLEGRPGIEDILAALSRAGLRQVRLVPLLLVAGSHFRQDLTGDHPDSWQRRLEAAGIMVSPVSLGLGRQPQVADLFCRHIAAALDVIPGRGD